MAIALQADGNLPQGYITVNGQRVATLSPTLGLSASNIQGTGIINASNIQDSSITVSKFSSEVPRVRAWVNFNGQLGFFLLQPSPGSGWPGGSGTITATLGSDIITVTSAAGTGFTENHRGVRFTLPSINGVAGDTFGGRNVSTVAVQYTTFISAGIMQARLLDGPALVGQTTSTFGWQGLAIRESYNVSSVQRVAVGIYRINFIEPMPHRHYAINCEGLVYDGFSGSSAFGGHFHPEYRTTQLADYPQTTHCFVAAYNLSYSAFVDQNTYIATITI